MYDRKSRHRLVIAAIIISTSLPPSSAVTISLGIHKVYGAMGIIRSRLHWVVAAAVAVYLRAPGLYLGCF